MADSHTARGQRRADRAERAGELRVLYEQQGMTVRDLAERIARSYGYTHKLLQEAGTLMRPKGGALRRQTST